MIASHARSGDAPVKHAESRLAVRPLCEIPEHDKTAERNPDTCSIAGMYPHIPNAPVDPTGTVRTLNCIELDSMAKSR